MNQSVILTTKEELKEIISSVISENIGKINVKEEEKPDTLTVQQAAEFINLSVPTLYGKTHKRSIPHYKMGKKLYFKRTELEKWISNQKVKTISDIEAEADKYIQKNKTDI